jgi:hypothetical protein
MDMFFMVAMTMGSPAKLGKIYIVPQFTLRTEAKQLNVFRRF